MEFTSFDDIKNLLDSDGKDKKPKFSQRNSNGNSVKIRNKNRQSQTMGQNTMLVINNDTENIQFYQNNKKIGN
jgi:hypothetical protein